MAAAQPGTLVFIMNIELSTGKLFNAECEGWAKYIDWIDLGHLKQVITLDTSLNPYVADCGDWQVSLEELEETTKQLPVPDGDREYYQWKVMLDEDGKVPKIPGFVFVGIDLSDETHTSSILNCGAWDHGLKQYKSNISDCGLLPLDIAMKVRGILPDEWRQDAHAYVDLWAIYKKRN